MILTCLLLLLSAPNGASVQQFKAAQDAYDSNDYATAVTRFKELLAAPVWDVKMRQDARLMLSFASYWRKDLAGAKQALQALFAENVDYAFDRDFHHPDLVRFYTSERAAYVESVKVIVVKPPPASKPTVIEKPKPPVEGTLGDRKPWLRAFPFVGHFANNDKLGGSLFIAAEVIFLGMNIAAAIISANMRFAQNDYQPGAERWQIVQNVGGGGAIGVAAFAILDAFLWSPARGRQ